MSFTLSVGLATLVYLGACTLAAFLSVRLLGWLQWRGILDQPTERSLHATPTPRGGGLVIAGVGLLALAVFWPLGLISSASAHTMLVLMGGAALLGWLDDQYSLPAGLRFAVQCALVVIGLGVFDAANAWELGVSLFTALAVLWLINLYNFMDGADGLAGVQGASAGLIAALILWQASLPGLASLSAALSAGCVGFLCLNWPPARVFMGDVGSYCLGAGFGALAWRGHLEGGVSPLVWVILLAPFLIDASLTLSIRVWAGHSPIRAHRDHVYQRLIQAGRRPWQLLAALISLEALLLGPLAVWLAGAGAPQQWAATAGTLICGSLLWAYLHRTTAPHRRG